MIDIEYVVVAPRHIATQIQDSRNLLPTSNEPNALRRMVEDTLAYLQLIQLHDDRRKLEHVWHAYVNDDGSDIELDELLLRIREDLIELQEFYDNV